KAAALPIGLAPAASVRTELGRKGPASDQSACRVEHLLQLLEQQRGPAIDMPLAQELLLEREGKVERKSDDVGQHAERDLLGQKLFVLFLGQRRLGDEAAEAVEQFALHLSALACARGGA